MDACRPSEVDACRPSASTMTVLQNAHGAFVPVVDRQLRFKKKAVYETAQDKASYLEAAVERASGSAAQYELNRKKVLAFCPDGAADEQLGGRLATRCFPNLAFVVRCATHAAHGSFKSAWQQDDEVRRVKTIVQEVGKFLRHSDRFRARFESKAQDLESKLPELGR